MALKHSVYDTDSHYKIDKVTRAINDQSTTPTKLMQYDHNSERFTFEIDRLVDGHDMSLCDKVEVHFLNVDASTKESNADVHLVEDLGISPDSNDVVIFSWLISRNATLYAGVLNFRIRFVCLDDDGIEIYAWHSDIFKGITVSNGIHNTEMVLEEYSDLLTQWKNEINNTLERWKTEIDETLSGGEWDFIIDSYDRLGEIENMYGNVLISCEASDEYPIGIDVPNTVTYLKMDISIYSDYAVSYVKGHSKCTLDGCTFGRSGTISGFREVRNVGVTDGTISNCGFVYNCTALDFTNCNYVELAAFEDTGGNEGQSASISKCRHICHINYYRTMGNLNISNCDVVENIDGWGAELTITNAKTVDAVSGFISVEYTDCKYVNPYTCQNYVTQQGASGKVQVLTEDGTFEAVEISGGGVDEETSQRITDLENAVCVVEEEVEKLSARLDDLEVETPTEFAWLDVLANIQNAQTLFNNAQKYKFEGTIRDSNDFNGYGDLDFELIRNAIRFRFEFTPDSIPDISNNQTVTGKVSNFSVVILDSMYNGWALELYNAGLNSENAAMSVERRDEDYGEPTLVISVAIDVNLEYFYEADGTSRGGSGSFYLFNRNYITQENYWDGHLDTIDAYVGKTSETAPFFPATMSLREESIKRQLIAFLEECKARHEANTNNNS